MAKLRGNTRPNAAGSARAAWQMQRKPRMQGYTLERSAWSRSTRVGRSGSRPDIKVFAHERFYRTVNLVCVFVALSQLHCLPPASPPVPRACR